MFLEMREHSDYCSEPDLNWYVEKLIAMATPYWQGQGNENSLDRSDFLTRCVIHLH